ncbi:MAG: HAD-IB family hydrolase [Euryarchaeota archaeon]|nr:HAD-IB family hydrolase [Euryarchaeota archaeon]
MIDKAVLDALRAAIEAASGEALGKAKGAGREAQGARAQGSGRKAQGAPPESFLPVAPCPSPLAPSSPAPCASRPAPSIALFDLDGTLARGHMIFDFPAHLGRAGLFPPASLDEVGKMRADFSAGKLTYRFVAERLPLIYAEGVKGQRAEIIALEAERFVEGRMDRVFAYARPLVRLMREAGRPALALSGSPVETVGALARRIGIEASVGTDLATRGGRFTGGVLQNYILGETKSAALSELVKTLRLEMPACFGFGDTEQDVSFLGRVGHPVCLNPSKELRAEALKKGWPMLGEAEDVVAKVRELVVRADAV